jgi:recombination protein RecA
MKKTSTGTLLEKLNNKYPEAGIVTAADSIKTNTEFIPTGIATVDALLNGGIPKGMISVFVGEYSTLKSATALLTCASVIKNGGKAAYIDVEGSVTSRYLSLAGIPQDSPDFIRVSKGVTAEKALDILCDVVASGEVDVVVLDSISSLTPKAELEGEMGDQLIGLRARLMGKVLRKVTQLCKDTNTAVVLITQYRTNMQAMGNASPKLIDGGKAVGFFPDVICEFARVQQIKSGEDVTGHHIQVKTLKSKVSRGFYSVGFVQSYVDGIDFGGSFFDCGVKLGRVTAKGSHYYFDGEAIGQGRVRAARWFVDKPDVCLELLEGYRVLINGADDSVIVEDDSDLVIE